jgi:hypothetical protein
MPTLGEVRISELPGANPLDGTEIIPLVQAGVTPVCYRFPDEDTFNETQEPTPP